MCLVCIYLSPFIIMKTYNSKWNQRNLQHVITDTLPLVELGPNKIDSVQNAIMLVANIHTKWDKYRFGIDVDVRISPSPGYNPN